MIIEKIKSIGGKIIELYTPENEDDLKKLNEMEENGEIDRRENFADDPESFGFTKKTNEDIKE